MTGIRATSDLWREPMLATLTERRFSDPDWLFERKLDGVRVLAAGDGEQTTLWSRDHNDISSTYPELVDALSSQPHFVVDGEVVAFERGQISFSRLQERMHRTGPQRIGAGGVAVYYYLFDLLIWDGYDLTGLPLRKRKSLLRKALSFDDPLRFSVHRNTEGERFYAHACARGWEGIVAKRAAGPYRAGRSHDWLKFKCVREQDLVVGGFTEPSGLRTGLGALLLGYYEGERLRYAGKVGTGFDDATLRRLRHRLEALEEFSSPFDEALREHLVHWVDPTLVVQVGFSEWTSNGRLRHPHYLGEREDKPPGQVVRES